MIGIQTSKKLGSRFAEALRLAHLWHAGQRRKGSDVPYVAHPLAVCALVLEDGGNEAEAIAALLHDTIEDAESQEEAIRRRAAIDAHFGADVLDIVLGCTDGDPAEKLRMPYLERKGRYAERLKHAPADVRRVAAADKLHNARTMVDDHDQVGSALWRRFRGSAEEVLGHYRAVADALVAAGTGRLAAWLDRAVAELEQRAAMESPSGRADPAA